MQGGKRKLSSWNIFVKKVYNEGKSKNASYSFQEALKDASKRKSEMGSSNANMAHGTKKTRRHSRRRSRRSMSASASMQAAGTRRRRRHHKKH